MSKWKNKNDKSGQTVSKELDDIMRQRRAAPYALQWETASRGHGVRPIVLQPHYSPDEGKQRECDM